MWKLRYLAFLWFFAITNKSDLLYGKLLLFLFDTYEFRLKVVIGSLT